MFDLISDDILNSFAIKMKLADLNKRLENKRTPKKYIQPLTTEIARYERLLKSRIKEEKL